MIRSNHVMNPYDRIPDFLTDDGFKLFMDDRNDDFDFLLEEKEMKLKKILEDTLVFEEVSTKIEFLCARPHADSMYGISNKFNQVGDLFSIKGIFIENKDLLLTNNTMTISTANLIEREPYHPGMLYKPDKINEYYQLVKKEDVPEDIAFYIEVNSDGKKMNEKSANLATYFMNDYYSKSIHYHDSKDTFTSAIFSAIPESEDTVRFINSIYDSVSQKGKLSDARYLISGNYDLIRLLIDQLGKVLNCPVSYFNMNEYSNSSILLGFDSTYKDSDEGVLIKELRKREKGIIVLQNVDGMAETVHDGRLQEFVKNLMRTGISSNQFYHVDMDLNDRILICTCDCMDELSIDIKESVAGRKRINLEKLIGSSLDVVIDYLNEEMAKEFNTNAAVLSAEIREGLRKKTIATTAFSDLKDSLRSLYQQKKQLSDEYSVNDYLGMYRKYYENYDKEIRNKIEELLRKDKEEDEEANQRMLSYLIHIHDGEKKQYQDINSYCTSLIGMESVEKEIRSMLYENSCSQSKRSTNLCLVGEPGCGKSSIAEEVGKQFGLGVIKVSCGSLSSNSLNGDFYNPGVIAEGIKENETNHCLIILDEIEKASESTLNGLVKLLDNNASFYDNYLKVNLDMNHIVVIATANDPSKLPDYLFNRLKMVVVQPYDLKTKQSIAYDAILQEQYADFDKKLICERSKMDLYVLEHYFNTIRDLKRNIRSCYVHSLLSGSDHLNLENQPLEKKEDSEGIYAVGVHSLGGIVTRLNCVLSDDGSNKIMGNAHEEMKEGFEEVIAAITLFKPSDKKVILQLEGAEHKEGKSIDLAIAAAVLSQLEGIHIYNSAFTGVVNLNGTVTEIGAVYQKLMLCRLDKRIRTVYIPQQNYAEYEAKKEDFEGLKVISIGSLEELSQRLKEEEKEHVCIKRNGLF